MMPRVMGKVKESLRGGLFDKFLSILLYILFLVLVTEVIWSIAKFAWNFEKDVIDTEKILGLSSRNIAGEIVDYAQNFDPYSNVVYVLFFGACILIFYLVFGIFSCKGLILRKKIEEIKRKKRKNQEEISKIREKLKTEDGFPGEFEETVDLWKKLLEVLGMVERDERDSREKLIEIINKIKEVKIEEESEDNSEVIEKLEEKLKTIQNLKSKMEISKEIENDMEKEEQRIQKLETKSTELITVVFILLSFDLSIFFVFQSNENARVLGSAITVAFLLVSQLYLMLRDEKFRSRTTRRKAWASLLICCSLVLIFSFVLLSTKWKGDLHILISTLLKNPSDILTALRNLSGETVKLILGLTIHLVLLLYCAFKISVWLSEWEKAKKSMVNYLRSHNWSIGVVICLIPVYILLCFLLSEIWKDRNLLGVVMLLSISTLISLGLFFDGFIISRVLDKNNGIFKEMGIIRENTTDNFEGEALIDKLRNHISSLLINLLTAIISYLFLSAVLSYLLPNKDVISLLVIFIYVPLYIFFYGSFLDIMRSVYQYIYSYIERTSDLVPDKARRDSVVNLFWRLTRIGIIVVIAFHLLHVVELSGDLTRILSHFKEILTIVIAVPLGFWILVVVLDPFFEKEIIEVGTERGEIIRIGPFFTKLETMTGEKIYIPNAELMARTIRRLSRREPSDKHREYRERWILISFSCTLSYEYNPTDVEKIFRNFFIQEAENERRRIKNYLERIGFEKASEEIESVFSEGAKTFMSVDDFKDHGITYRFNFRMRDSFYAPLFRSYFMKRFREKMEDAGMRIATPLKLEMNEL